MSTIEQILASSAELATLPAVYLEVKRVVDDPRSTPIDLANALSADPVMAARVLRLVNSAFWGLRGGIDSLPRAVSLLGMIHIHDLVLASSVVQTFERVPPRLMDMALFWRASVFRSLAATGLARKSAVVDLGRVFVQALLSDLGHMVLYLKVPELAAQALESTRGRPWERAARERELIGCDFAQVGGALTDAWRLPPGFGEAIRQQNQPQDTSAHALEASLIHIAALLSEGSPQTPHWDELLAHISPFAWQSLKLDASCLVEVLPEVEDSLASTAQLFGVALQRPR
jgi:HD-like signal output (HDOD) protein